MADVRDFPKSFAEKSLNALITRGFAKAQIGLTLTERHELEAEFGRPSLLRTTHDASLMLIGLADDKRGTISVNRLTDEALDEAVESLWEVTGGSQPDPANDIAPAQPALAFDDGPDSPDVDRMYRRLDELLDHSRSQYPTLTIRQSHVDFTNETSWLLNSNGVDYTARRGRYGAVAMFSAKEGERVSSFNYSSVVRYDLDQPLAACGTFDALLRQSTQQVNTRKVPGKFTGDLIITPDCLGSFLGFLLERLSDGPMIAGTSLYQNRIDARVAAHGITLRSMPRDLPGGYCVTGDGFEAQNRTVLDDGMLRSYLLSQYGARKTGLDRADTGGCWVMDGGAASLDELVGAVDRGILITRFSGGRPSDKGDFSGIAKNSYYIENGEIRFPVAETMVSGNMAELLENVVGLSRERADYGTRVLPWMRATGIGVS
jgi:PmbA protein